MIDHNITIENARLMFRNFSGEEGKYNRAGDRNFCVAIDPSIAEELKSEGWNIRYLKPRNEDDLPQPYLQVGVKFDPYPPKIVLVTSNGKTRLMEENVNVLDWAEFKNVDLTIRPYNYNINGNPGTKAYLKTMYVVIQEDDFESKYYDVPDSAVSAVGQ